MNECKKPQRINSGGSLQNHFISAIKYESNVIEEFKKLQVDQKITIAVKLYSYGKYKNLTGVITQITKHGFLFVPDVKPWRKRMVSLNELICRHVKIY
jgi:hypothetical protein